jgi:hypothetical protein
MDIIKILDMDSIVQILKNRQSDGPIPKEANQLLTDIVTEKI